MNNRINILFPGSLNYPLLYIYVNDTVLSQCLMYRTGCIFFLIDDIGYISTKQCLPSYFNTPVLISLKYYTLRELPAFCVSPRCVSFFYAPNCINAPQKVNLKKMHPAAFYFSCPYTNGILLRIIIKDYIITQSLINEAALNLPL